MKKLFILIALVLFPVFANGQTTEQILNYHSDITVQTDASVVVTETIKVISTGEQIRRGIYRDFPIAYKDAKGYRYYVGFEILEITRNGNAEPYHTERSGNGQRIYIGEEDVFVEPGEHVYTIKYQTERQIGFFDYHDELYWNVTGNGWVFPIQSASATVTLPDGTEILDTLLYTGVQGSTSTNGDTTRRGSKVVFATNTSLAANEGLTIVVTWPKGVVAAPTQVENFWTTVKANLDYIVGFVGLVLAFIYYFWAWWKVGRDPKIGTIIAQYESPNNLSPALVRYIKNMGNDEKSFAAALIQLGVKQKVEITEEKGFFKRTKYTVSKKDSQAELNPEEQVLYDKLFSSGGEIKLEKKNAKEISEIREEFNESIQEQGGKKYFVKNGLAVAGGIMLSGIVLAATIITAAAIRYDITSFLPFVFWPVFGVLLLLINIVFGSILKRYTKDGRKVLDEIEGFKLFLSVTEKDRLAFHNPPERTPQLFEKMLPYALALGVEHAWAEQFTDVFANLKNQGVNYTPGWYHGNISSFQPTAFASTMGDTFSGVVSSASTPPGSSSGSSGGFSGGGGGGGGGGGW